VSDEQIIEYLRTRGRAQLPPGFVRSVMAAIDDAPAAPWRFSAYLPAVMAAGAVAIVVVLALLLGLGRDVGPAPSPSPTTSISTVEELRAAVTDATEQIAEAPGVQGMHTAWIEQYVASATWFDWRPNGDQVVVASSDIDVQAPWWTDPDGEPLSFGERIRTDMYLIVGDSWVRAEDGSWLTHGDGEEAPRGPLTYGIGMLTGQIPAVPPTDGIAQAIATRRDLGDGGQLWVLEGSEGEGTWRAEWHIGPDGLLMSYASEGVDVTMFPSEAFGTGSQRFTLEFTPIDDPEPIPTLDRDTVWTPADFGLPEDFPLKPGPWAG